jgi:type I restriction enzyme, S subunit
LKTLESYIDIKNLDKSEWKVYKFEKIAKSIGERVEPTNTDLEIYVGLEHLDSDSIHIKRYGKKDDVSGTKLRCYPGDVIFGRRRAYQRKAAIVEFDGFCSAHSLVLRPNPDVIDPRLFPFFLHSDTFMHRAIDISVGSLSPTINWGTLKNEEFLLPPKDQQARLAELLWAADEVVEKNNGLIDSLSNGGINLLRNRFSTLNGRLETFGSIGSWVSGGTPSTKIAKYWHEGNVLWVTPKDMKGQEVNDTLDKLTEFAVSHGVANVFNAGSFVVVWRSGILQHSLPVLKVVSDFTINQDLKVFKPLDGIRSEYVRIYLKVYAEKIRHDCVKEGTTVQSIDTTSFMKSQIPIPSESDQDLFIEQEKILHNSYSNALRLLKDSKQLQKSLINQIF